MQPPKSAVHSSVTLTGLASFLLGSWFLYYVNPFADQVQGAFALILFVGLMISLADMVLQGAFKRDSTGLDFSKTNPSIARTATKLLGLLGSFGFIAILYWIFPEYDDSFYEQYYALLRMLLPTWIIAALPYFYIVDRHMRTPKDGYWNMGQLLLCRWSETDGAVVRQHLLGWLVKGYFLPLMFTYMCKNVADLQAMEISALAGFAGLYNIASILMYLLDVTFVSMGYLMTLRLTDTHIRSTDPAMLGWVAALSCYDPFWNLVSGNYLGRQNENALEELNIQYPAILFCIGLLTLLSLLVYTWATVAFGCRFSNLTHRGVITNGPYRWTKHPAYLAKNVGWWLGLLPFIGSGGVLEAVKKCLLMLALNGLYYLRARTEEKHLSKDQDYVRYAEWINEHGMFRVFRKIPVLRVFQYRYPF